jgi:hypothetical protein
MAIGGLDEEKARMRRGAEWGTGFDDGAREMALYKKSEIPFIANS